MTAITKLNNSELIFFEKAFSMIIILENGTRRLNLFTINKEKDNLLDIASYVGEFISTYKKLFNPDVSLLTEKELNLDIVLFTHCTTSKLESVLLHEYNKIKNTLTEYADESDIDSQIFLEVAKDVFEYTNKMINQRLILTTDHSEKFKEWISKLSDGMI